MVVVNVNWLFFHFVKMSVLSRTDRHTTNNSTDWATLLLLFQTRQSIIKRMKRSQEDDENGLKRTKEYDKPQEANTDPFQLYLRHRSRDNTPTVRVDNPFRYQNAIFELAFHLNLNRDARETSWLYFQTVISSLNAVPDVRIVNIDKNNVLTSVGLCLDCLQGPQKFGV
jgi:hypothetical protein